MNDYSLEVHVVGHVSRKAMTGALVADVEADYLWTDEGYHGEWRNHLRAWKTAQDSKMTHAVVLQDDAVPIGDFRKHVLEAVKHQPNDMISLYTGTHRPRKQQVLDAVEKAENSKASWLMADTLMWGVGVVLPVDQIETMLDSVAKLRLPYDQRLGRWIETTDRWVYYTWPSLVDHADTKTVAHADKVQGVRVAHKVGVPNWNPVYVSIAQKESAVGLASKRDIV